MDFPMDFLVTAIIFSIFFHTFSLNCTWDENRCVGNGEEYSPTSIGFQRAFNDSTIGDTVYIRGGVYFLTDTVTVSTNGSELRNYPNEDVIIIIKHCGNGFNFMDSLTNVWKISRIEFYHNCSSFPVFNAEFPIDIENCEFHNFAVNYFMKSENSEKRERIKIEKSNFYSKAITIESTLPFAYNWDDYTHRVIIRSNVFYDSEVSVFPTEIISITNGRDIEISRNRFVIINKEITLFESNFVDRNINFIHFENNIIEFYPPIGGDNEIFNPFKINVNSPTETITVTNYTIQNNLFSGKHINQLLVINPLANLVNQVNFNQNFIINNLFNNTFVDNYLINVTSGDSNFVATNCVFENNAFLESYTTLINHGASGWSEDSNKVISNFNIYEKGTQPSPYYELIWMINGEIYFEVSPLSDFLGVLRKTDNMTVGPFEYHTCSGDHYFYGPECNLCPKNYEKSSCDECRINFKDPTTGCVQCRNSWFGTNCSQCPSNFNEDIDCGVCKYRFYPNYNCTLCPKGFGPNCHTCINHFSGTDCNICHSNRDNDCLHCKNEWKGDDCLKCDWKKSNDCKKPIEMDLFGIPLIILAPLGIILCICVIFAGIMLTEFVRVQNQQNEKIPVGDGVEMDTVKIEVRGSEEGGTTKVTREGKEEREKEERKGEVQVEEKKEHPEGGVKTEEDIKEKDDIVE